MSEWNEFTRSVQAKAGESPCIWGIGAGNSMAFLRFYGMIFYKIQSGDRMKFRWHWLMPYSGDYVVIKNSKTTKIYTDEAIFSHKNQNKTK